MITKFFNKIMASRKKARMMQGYFYGQRVLKEVSWDQAFAMWDRGRTDPTDFFDKGFEMAIMQHKAMAEDGTVTVLYDGKVIGVCNSYGEWDIPNAK